MHAQVNKEDARAFAHWASSFGHEKTAPQRGAVFVVFCEKFCYSYFVFIERLDGIQYMTDASCMQKESECLEAKNLEIDDLFLNIHTDKVRIVFS